MIQKLEKLLDLLIAVLERELGSETAPASVPTTVRRARKTAPVPESEPEPDDPFAGMGAPLKPTPEETMEASRRCIEVMGAFIKKHMNDKPISGQQQAKKIIQIELGHSLGKLTDLTYEDNVKLIPRFEQELDA
jgi:hypothetical protein